MRFGNLPQLSCQNLEVLITGKIILATNRKVTENNIQLGWCTLGFCVNNGLSEFLHQEKWQRRNPLSKCSGASFISCFSNKFALDVTLNLFRSQFLWRYMHLPKALQEPGTTRIHRSLIFSASCSSKQHY